MISMNDFLSSPLIIDVVSSPDSDLTADTTESVFDAGGRI